MKAFITVIGHDTVGVVARVSGLCSELNINIEDVTQSILQGMFAMIMLVDISKCSVSHEELHQKMDALAAELAQEKYHLVLANIVADVIIPLSARVPQMLAEDGVFLCSGIIDTRAHEVEAALKKNGLTVTRKREKNGWVALEAKLG